MDGGNPHRNFTSWKPQLPSSLGMPHSVIFRSDMIFHYLGEKYLLRLMSFRSQLYGNIWWISNYMEILWKSYGIWKPYEDIWKHEELMLHNCTNMMLKCQPATVIGPMALCRGVTPGQPVASFFSRLVQKRKHHGIAKIRNRKTVGLVSCPRNIMKYRVQLEDLENLGFRRTHPDLDI